MSSTPGGCARCSRTSDAADLAVVERAIAHPGRRHRRRDRRRPVDVHHHRPAPGGSVVNRLSQFAVSQAERHAPAGRRPVHRRHLGLGHPQAGAPAGHRVPGHHGHRPVPRCRLAGRRGQGGEADRARHLRRGSARHRPVDVGQLASPWSSPSSSTGRTSRRPSPRSRRGSPTPACPTASSRTVTALNINASPVMIASIARDRRRTAWRRRGDRPGPRSCPEIAPSRASRAPT